MNWYVFRKECMNCIALHKLPDGEAAKINGPTQDDKYLQLIIIIYIHMYSRSARRQISGRHFTIE